MEWEINKYVVYNKRWGKLNKESIFYASTGYLLAVFVCLTGLDGKCQSAVEKFNWMLKVSSFEWFTQMQLDPTISLDFSSQSISKIKKKSHKIAVQFTCVSPDLMLLMNQFCESRLIFLTINSCHHHRIQHMKTKN